MKKMTTTIPTSTILSTNFTENTYVASDTEVSFTSPYNINPIVKWLEEHAKPLKTTNPTASLNDLKPLKDMVGSASIVGLGETTHGAHEVFTMKHRIVHYLVSEKGFTNLVLEEGWDRALKLDRYVLTGKGNPNQYLSPEFKTKEIVDLINWIKEYNTDPKHKSKVRVIGMDIQSVSKNIYNNITEYVRRNNPKLLPSLEEKIKDLIPVTKDINIFSGLTKENKEKYISDAKQINALLEQNKNTLNGNSKEFAWIKQTARIIEQFTTMAASFPDNPSEFFLKHDIAMYENVKWTEEHLGKTIVWAHNGHVSKTNMIPFIYPKVAGQHLAEHYRKRYVSIGTSVFEGQYNVYNSNREFGPYGILKSDDPNSYNYTFGQVKNDQFLLDLRKENGITNTWLNEKHPIFSGITTEGPDIPKTVDISLGKSFDILVQIQKVSPSQLNH
ncbi:MULTISPECIES: erythromycin esterase family protein [Bacillus]|uniref:Erythromycin esterase n=2 Tax=Bacillus cereus group TaxID=86661 RepID=A0A2B0WLF9_BACAN|nr:MULTISPECIES: erythromycin esterase family protein [Bacillus]KZD29531.1 Succinoglycan biosynthesis protein [Bacillus cereus]MBJ8060789.1 erythromycin esterase family protein [Bacillus cereus]MCU4758061.1 erythromycin esterase family protein [Bacillus cereus]MCU5108209.1 erythromycin esterase family protein [Bacillus cereus]MCU5339408.1 erythromycin esterase family protein [Bacillus cereus]